MLVKPLGAVKSLIFKIRLRPSYPQSESGAFRTQPGKDRQNRRELWYLIVAASLYCITFCFYYPPLPGIEDEVGYINQAAVWLRGAVSTEGAGLDYVYDFALRNGRHVSVRNPGRSLVALPFLAFANGTGVFISGMFIHVAVTLIAALLCIQANCSPLWALLILCDPVLVLYSRTVMGDEASALGILLAVYAALRSRRRGLWAGVALSAAIIMRYHTAIVAPIFAWWFFRRRCANGRTRADWVHFCLVIAATAATLAMYNLWLYGDTSHTIVKGTFNPRHVAGNLVVYLLSLLLVWPFMFVVPLFDSSVIRPFSRGIGGLFFVLMVNWYFHDIGRNWFETLVLSQRLLIPALPLWLVSYAAACNGLLKRICFQRAAVYSIVHAGCVALLLEQWVVASAHQNHLLRLERARRELVQKVPTYFTILANGTMAKTIGVVPARGVTSTKMRAIAFEEDPCSQSGLPVPPERHWVLAYLSKTGGHPPIRACVDRYKLTRIQTSSQGLWLYSTSSAGK